MKLLKMKFIILYACIYSIKLNAQVAILPAGLNASSNSGSVSYSIGQIDYINFKNSSNSINLGIQQPKELFNAAIFSHTKNNIKIQVFPNPTVDNCKILLETSLLNNLTFELYDLSGKLLTKGNLQQNTNLNLEDLASAMYVLKVNENNLHVQSIKIIKK